MITNPKLSNTLFLTYRERAESYLHSQEGEILIPIANIGKAGSHFLDLPFQALGFR